MEDKVSFKKIDLLLSDFAHSINQSITKRYQEYEVRVISINEKEKLQFWVDLDEKENTYIINLWDFNKRKVIFYSNFKEFENYLNMIKKIMKLWNN